MILKAIAAFMICSFGNSCFSDEKLPKLFDRSLDQLIYFHSHQAIQRDLELARSLHPVFEIDLAWAHSAFNDYVKKGMPYIGHPEEFYTKEGKPFPKDNVSLEEFQNFLKSNPRVKVLIDVKDEKVFPYLESFVKTVGAERCIAHAFIKNWTRVPPGASLEAHWKREDIDLFALNEVLVRLGVPLIANCRGFSDQHVKKIGLLAKMIEDARVCRSVVSLGFYYQGAPLPAIELLESINRAGYFAWVNGNLKGFKEKIGTVKCIAMSDDMQACTRF